jgi:hypothetical protein
MAIAECPCPLAGNTTFYAFYIDQKIKIRNDILFHAKLELNSFYIINSNGLQRITIPIKKINSGKAIRCDEVLISYDTNWPKMLMKSLQSAYGKSPFFEFYEDDIQFIIESRPALLIELNLKMHEFVMNELQVKVNELNSPPEQNSENIHLNFNTKLKGLTYEQVFASKFGFLQPVSILDLLFNEARASSIILRKSNE